MASNTFKPTSNVAAGLAPITSFARKKPLTQVEKLRRQIEASGGKGVSAPSPSPSPSPSPTPSPTPENVTSVMQQDLETFSSPVDDISRTQETLKEGLAKASEKKSLVDKWNALTNAEKAAVAVGTLAFVGLAVYAVSKKK